ncbi:uncharacterized protein LOC105424515 isoform X2 [Pogonomyrmex barbatus]|uniref:Uncharacterized protein LOC105424515 isoform X2 n=1 Tax=Pogonomyrmex barbatus TaxID=144034 RepID=A0A6I9W0D0_9HYME|nr:uncharacterized protein LOC105424515 isoform X2 [Pogonomyrmex barbatus]
MILLEKDTCRLQGRYRSTPYDLSVRDRFRQRVLGIKETASSDSCCIPNGTSYIVYVVTSSLAADRYLRLLQGNSYTSSIHPMANYTRYAFVIAIIVSIVCGEDSNEFENVDRNLLGLNLPYGRGLDNEMQLAKLLLMVPRFCHPKRNSELINSLLGLPKNMHNAGK